MSLKVTLSLLSLAVLGDAQQSAWGQCGGKDWAGLKTCVSGYYCYFSNEYYSQCVPGSDSTTKVSTTVVPTTIKTSTTQSSTTSSSTPKPTGAAGLKYLITFGDSYSQTGFDVGGTKPSTANPFGNPGYPGYTTSGGPNWIGYYTTVYNTSLVYSYNFASGGATTDSALIPPYASTVKSFVEQVQQFTASIASKPSYAPWTSTNALFGVWIGVNDVGNRATSSDWSTLVNSIMDKYFEQLQILYKAGARKFVLLSVPPIYKTPSVIGQGTATQNAQISAISTYNKLISSKASAFQSANSGAIVTVYDTTTAFNTALANPTAYGARDATCYDASGTVCLWWNDYHPGLAIQKLVAQGVAAKLGNW